MEFAIKQAEFVTSAGLGSPYPEKTAAEIAIVGKSNVGKSSLINSLCNNKKLAKTSSNPGKTRLINFFKINREFYFVDLPGYGFARAPKTEKDKWGKLMEDYLSSGRVDHIFMLIDIRHAPTDGERSGKTARRASRCNSFFLGGWLGQGACASAHGSGGKRCKKPARRY